jgi:hypothetical protein
MLGLTDGLCIPPDGGIPLETIRRVMERVDRANKETVDVTPGPAPLPLDHKR